MALKIRLRQQGRTNRQTYRVVVADERSPRDGKYIELLGWYNPCAPQESSFSVNAERISYWLSQGAQISPQVAAITKKGAPEVMKEHHDKVEAKKVKMRAKRRALKKKP
ncbi:MAG: 30S ribosomal protein S16 [Chlamydiota bacterium]